MSSSPAELVPTGPQMSAVERWAFAAGDCFGGGAAATIAVLYLFYLTDILGMAPGMAGMTILVSKIWDALNHPLMGLITDRTRTKWGRRRPWILGGAVLIPPGMAALWAPIGDWNDGAKLWFVIIAHLAWTTIASIVAVPYASLSAEVTTYPAERNRVNVMRLAFATLSGAGSTLVMSILVADFKAGSLTITQLYLSLIFGFGLFFAVPLLGVALHTHERAPIPGHLEKLSVKAVVAPLRLRSFRYLTVMYLCPAISIDIVTAVILYYALYAVPGLRSVNFLAVFVAVTLTMFPILIRLVGRVSKNVIYYRALPLSIAAMCVIALYPPHLPHWPVYVLAGVLAVGLGAAQITVWVMFPDVVDDGELRLGSRDAGAFSGLLVLVRALASALAIQILSLVLELTGYQQSRHGQFGAVQPPSAIWGIRLSMMLSVAVFMGIGYLVARRYPLTKSAVAQLHDDLERAREERDVVEAEGTHRSAHHDAAGAGTPGPDTAADGA